MRETNNEIIEHDTINKALYALLIDKDRETEPNINSSVEIVMSNACSFLVIPLLFVF